MVYYQPDQKLFALRALPARIIALEGIDQSGKKTQTRLLLNRLRREGFKAGTISFPIYSTPVGHQIRRFLNGRQVYSPEALHMLYSLNRWENRERLHKLIANSDYLIADRYTPSNIAYGVSRGLSLDWLKSLDKGLPTPDLVIVLDVPVPSSFSRKRRNRDAHERDTRFLARVRQTYQRLAAKLGWETIDGNMHPRDVELEVQRIVASRFGISFRAS